MVLAAMALAAADAVAAAPAGTCRVASAAPGTPAAVVAAVVDERTLRLTDGTELRLDGLAGLADPVGASAAGPAAAARAMAALRTLALGKPLAVEPLALDRYGRRVALAALADDAGGPTLQEQLLARGAALVADRLARADCAGGFLTVEHAARAAHLGLWAAPHQFVSAAERPAALVRGRFALVEGDVLSVNDRGATVYVNFGRRWSQDFTVTIAKRNAARFTAAGLAPRSLAGRRIRIRGWIDERGGPWIEAVRPEQIEVIDRM
jgi:endonuclease YncB( thermonuclease family)